LKNLHPKKQEKPLAFFLDNNYQREVLAMPIEKIRTKVNFLYRLFQYIPLNVPLVLMQLIGFLLGDFLSPNPRASWED